MDRDPGQEWSKLERLLKEVGFGEVYNLPFESGKPQLQGKLRVRVSRLLGAHRMDRSGGKRSAGLRDPRFADLIRVCEERRQGVIAKLTVQDGMPQRIELEMEISAGN